MITEKELTDLHWYSRGDLGCMCFKTGRWFIQLYWPEENETRHFFKIVNTGVTMYLGNIPDKAAMILLMRWLEFPQYDRIGDPWNT